jgi:hypothetical protein
VGYLAALPMVGSIQDYGALVMAGPFHAKKRIIPGSPRLLVRLATVCESPKVEVDCLGRAAAQLMGRIHTGW